MSNAYRQLMVGFVLAAGTLVASSASAQQSENEIDAFVRQDGRVSAKVSADADIRSSVSMLAAALSPRAAVDLDGHSALIQLEELDIGKQLTFSPLGESDAVGIARAVVDQVVLSNMASAAGEGLELTRVQREWFGASTVENATKAKSHIVATHVLFRRTIGGVPVVSDPAAVRVVITNDRKVASLALHWIPLAVSTAPVQPATAEALHAEVSQMLDKYKAGVHNSHVVLRDLECGLLDPEIARPVNGRLSRGCRLHAVVQTHNDGATFKRGVRGVVGAVANDVKPKTPSPDDADK